MTVHGKSTSPLSRLLVAAGISLASLTACELELDAPEQRKVEGVASPTDQNASALTVNYYDFIAMAPGAVWSYENGTLPWGSDTIAKGACYMGLGAMEDGVSRPYLYTRPKWSANDFIRGAYSVTIPAAASNPRITATYGFLSGASGTSGATFSLLTKINGNWVTLFTENKTYTGALSTKTANLSAYAGQTITLFLSVDTGSSDNYDWTAWTDVRMLADNVTPPAACTIGGVQYVSGAANPAVSCQVCDPNTSTTAWTVRADSCLIGSQCYTADQQDSLKCRRCDPLTSQTSWTNQTQCDNLVVGTTNEQYKGGWASRQSRTWPDDSCAAEGAALGLPGTWKAMVSDPNVRDLKDTVQPVYASRPVVNLKGEQMYASWDAIFVDQVWPSGLSMYRFGTASTPFGSAYAEYVYTGTNATGVWDASGVLGSNCNEWQTEWLGVNYYARAGRFSSGARKLIDGGDNRFCGTFNPYLCVLVPPAPQVTVQNYDGTAQGTLQGRSQRNAFAYLGIPYAAPPTGSLRLAPPAKAASWGGIRMAIDQPQPCAQPPLIAPFQPNGGMIGSEDCLYLNVWTPKTATPTSNLPVLVFHHGGAHSFGGTKASDDWLAVGFLDGDRFAADRNAIVVTIQTRLGPLGYLTDPALAANPTSRTSTNGGGTSGNYGLLDNIQALKWVKRNISKFGGDPTKVLFFGESSGGTMVCDLLASPLAKDPADNKPLFSSAIIESGFCEQPSVYWRQNQSTAALPTLGCANAADKVACLRSAPVQNFVTVEGEILGLFPKFFGSILDPATAFGLDWGPHIDGYVLPTQPRLAFAAGTHNKVPTIVGTNKEEGTFFTLFMVGGILTGDLPNLIIIGTCGDRDTKVQMNLGLGLANAVKDIYPCNVFDILSPTKTYAEGVTHAQYECPARRTARSLWDGQVKITAQNPVATPVRRYWFTHRADNLGILQNLLGLVRDIGASHTFELPYIFNSHDTVLGYYPSTRERNLGTTMQTYWRNFANNSGLAPSDPNFANPAYGGSVPAWPAYVRSSDNTLKLEVTGLPGGIQVVNGVNTAKCDFWDPRFTLDGFY